jgi:ElaB/YqjD/DUF883 family membrane-anchored ribosome-binding protein
MDQNRTQQSAKPASVGESVARGRDAIGAAANEAMTAAASDMQAIRNDLNGLKETLARFIAQVSHETAKSARDVSASVGGQMKDAVGDAAVVADSLADKGAQFASSAGDQAKSFAAEIEAMARRNPLGALAGAVAVGFLIGLWGRRS